MVQMRPWQIVVTLLGVAILLDSLISLWARPQPSISPKLFKRTIKYRHFTPETKIAYLRDMWTKGHLRSHSELCPNQGARLLIFIAVTSSPKHVNYRKAVRYTWGQHHPNVSLAFVLGKPPVKYKAALDKEDSLYGDLIMGKNHDSYSTLPLKTLSILEWVKKYCSCIPLVLKTDDDTFINLPLLLQFISTRLNATRTIWGRVSRNERPKRYRTKYYVPKEQYPDPVYPRFVTGPAYLLTKDCVQLLLAAANPFMRYVRLEDVFVTGILAKKAGLVRKRAPEFFNKNGRATPCDIRRFVAMHRLQYNDQYDYWKKLTNKTVICRYKQKTIPT